MAHAVVVLIRGIVRVHLLKTVSACELLDFLLRHAKSAHGLHARVAHVHLITDEKASAPALVVHIGRLIGRQLVH